MTVGGTAARVTIVDVARQAAVSRQTVSNALTHPGRVQPRHPRAGDGRRSTSSATSPRRRPSRCARSAPGPSASRSTPSGRARTTRRWRPSSPRSGCAPGCTARTSCRSARPRTRRCSTATGRCGPVGWSTPSSSPTPTTATRARPGWRRTASRSRPSAGSGTTRPAPAGSTSTAPRAPGPPSAHCVDGRLRAPWPSSAGRTARSSVTTAARAGSRAAPRAGAATTPGPRRPRCRTSTPPATPPGVLLREIGPGDAVVCASDILALGVHHELLTAGLRPGLDVGVVGFDGSETALMHHLTSVAQPLDAIAEQVLVMLDDAMAGRPRPAAGVLLEPALTAREEHRPPAADPPDRPSTARPRPVPRP